MELVIGFVSLGLLVVGNIVAVVSSHVSMREELKHQKGDILEIKRSLHNGYQCKYHSEMQEKIGKLEGRSEGH
jgi:murein L,D-transpeptidase YafK